MRYLFIILFYCLSNINVVWSQWEQITGFQGICNNAILADSHTIWGDAGSGWIFKYSTNNSQFEYFNIGEDFDVNSLYLYNDSILILCGHSWSPAHTGFIFQYNVQIKSVVDTFRSPHQINDILFTSSDIGFAVSFEGIHATNDSGSTWKIIWSADSIGASFFELFALNVDNIGQLYASGVKFQSHQESNSQGFIIRSSDNGKTWELIFEEYTGVMLDNVKTVNNNLIYCHTRSNLDFYVSNNSGLNWNKKTLPINDPWLVITNIKYQNKDTIFITASEEILPAKSTYKTYNVILHSTDAGQSWGTQFENHPEIPPRDTSLTTIISLNDSILYCIGWNLFLRTTNAGGITKPIQSNNVMMSPEDNIVFTNPINDYLLIRNAGINYKYTIYSFSGKILMSSTAWHSDQIFVGHLNPGPYIIQISFSNNTTSSQIIIIQ